MTVASTEQDQAALTQLVAAQTLTQQQLTQMAIELAGGSAEAFTQWYDHAAIGTWAGQLAQMIEGIQSQSASLTDGYLAESLSQITGSAVSPVGTIDVGGLRQGVSHTEVYGRVTDTYRYQKSLGKSDEGARQIAVTRAKVMAQTDTQLAQRAQSRQFMMAKKVTGYRRVIHPEVSRGGTCGLCIAASDRIYSRGDLMPIHDRCACTTMAITAGADPGSQMNRSDLRALYQKADGSTSGAALKKVRYTVHENGELGPILALHGAPYRTPDDFPVAA